MNLELSANPTSSLDTTPSDSESRKNPSPTFRIEDRRSSSRISGGQPDTEASERSPYPTFVEELLAQTRQAEKKLAEKIQWMDEEVSRARERLSREQERKLEAEKRKIVQSFLEIGDHLERALTAAESSAGDAASLLKGIKLIQTVFLSKLQLQGAVAIQPIGKAFDPNVCEAVAMESVQEPELDQTVLEVLETGWAMGDQVLRPAKVKVASYAPA